MKKFLLVAVTSFLCSSVFGANWQRIGEHWPDSVYFIDLDSIKGSGDKFSATLKRNVIFDKVKYSVKEVYTYNCASEQQTLTYAQAYNGHDFSGSLDPQKFKTGVTANIDKDPDLIDRRSMVIACKASTANSSSVRALNPSGPFCSKATGLSKGFAEFVGGKMTVSVSSVSLLSASQDSYGSCAITVDTAKGPQRCVGATVYTNGKDFWIGGSCF
jgi:hypothetical protein